MTLIRVIVYWISHFSDLKSISGIGRVAMFDYMTNNHDSHPAKTMAESRLSPPSFLETICFPVLKVMDSQSNNEEKSFRDFGVCDTLCQTIESLGWKKPSAIQTECLKYAFEERDIIGLAETGSGKTGAFAIPIIQRLIDNPQRLFALILTPTRELAFQISEQFEALGASVGLKTAVIVGGVDMVQQALALARKPHVIIATPGRLVDHLENTKVCVWHVAYDP